MTGRGIGPKGSVTRGMEEAAGAPLVVEGTLCTDSEKTDELPPRMKNSCWNFAGSQRNETPPVKNLRMGGGV